MTLLQPRLATSREATPSPLLGPWYDSVQKWLSQLYASSFPLPPLPPRPASMHMHACAHMYAHTCFALWRWAGMRKGNFFQGSLSRRYSSLEIGPSEPSILKGTWHSSFPLPIWRMVWTLQQQPLTMPQLCPLTPPALLNLFHFLDNPGSFLPQALLWWEYSSSLPFWWTLVTL